MANISDLLNKIKSARYGRDVRSAIYDSIDAMNTESANAYDAAITAQNSAQASATSAEKFAAEAKQTVGNISQVAKTGSYNDLKDKPTNIETATKLQTARTINGIPFDGSKNISISDRKTSIVGEKTDVAAIGDWFKFALGKLYIYNDIEATFLIKSTYLENDFGILQMKLRFDNGTWSKRYVGWLVRNGFEENSVRVTTNDSGEYELYIKNPYGKYSKVAVEKISEFSRENATDSIVMNNTNVKEASVPIASVESSDVGFVLSAKKDENGNVIADTYATKASIEKWEKTGDTISADGCSGSEFSNYKSNIGLNMFSMFGRTPTKNSVSFSLPTATKIPFFQVNAMVHNKASGLYEPVAAYLYGTKCTVEIPDYSNYDIVRVSGIY